MKVITISKLKKGDFFTLKLIEEPTDSQVYVRDDYYPDCNKYGAYKFSDVNSERLFNGDKLVYVDFYF